MCHARKERVLLVGTDQRITSGPAATTAASRGRIHGCTRIVSRKVRFFSLAPRAPSIHVVGAVSVLRRAKINPQRYPWLTQLLARRPFKVVAVALANKLARIAWALLANGSHYRPQLATT